MSDTLNKLCRNQFRDFLIGRLWQGVIHNINGPLQIVSMNLELLKMLKDGDPDLPEQLWGRIEQIVDSIERIQNITNNLSRRKEHPYSTWTP
ncbi:histidine kinase dimerization/phospho-acceptor domain-containing protein, partial [Dissulfuribacter thermophilus]|uniref:histidine kinase dimerization/phospho-acceptor domain-containing protein n=1 Tax=Dissulfuribacter thermophilus TaxID=1156395 RepID=UPI0024465DD7